MNEIETHINKLFEKVTDSKRKQEIIQEVTSNLNEKVEDLVSKGQTRDQAIKHAIDDFGDIDDLKNELEGSAKIARSNKAGLSLAFSIWGALLIISLTLFINFYYSPQTIWFVFPSFAVIWWPMSMFFRWQRIKKDVSIGFPFSVCSFILIVGLILFINLYFSPKYIWFVYPTFAVIWWPLVMFFRSLRMKNRKMEEADE